MARRRTGIIEDLFDILQKMPWWMGVIVAALFWFLGPVWVGSIDKTPAMTAMLPLFTWLYKICTIVALVAAASSAIRGFSRRGLLNRQSGIDSLRALSWREFEQLVGEAYRRQGYDIEETGGGGADGGVDLILRGKGEKGAGPWFSRIVEYGFQLHRRDGCSSMNVRLRERA